MLKFFRDQKNSWLMKGILTLTALSFVSLFGTGRFLEKIPDEGKAVAIIAGQKITVAQFVEEVNRQVRAFSKMTQKPFTVKDAVQSGMLPALFNQAVSRLTMRATVDSLNLTVSDDAVRAAIANMPAFTDYNGSFSLSAYKKYLSETGVTEKRFIDDAFLDMRAQQLEDAAKSATVAPSETAALFYRLQKEKRTADVFTVKPETLAVKGEPSKQDRDRIYKELADDLIAPEYRTFTVLNLTLKDVSDKIKISEEELLESYNENKDSYSTEEIRDVDQMLFTSKEDADKAFDALKKGRDFMQVAEKYAHQTADQTKLGDLTPSTATGDWADVVFSAKKGEIVPPVQTAFGWQILRVNKITPKIEKSFKDVRDDIERKMVAAVAYDTLSETAVALDDRFGAGETIEEVARSTGYPVVKYTLVDPEGKDENGKQVNVPKTVLNTAFASDTSRESPMVEDGTDFFVLRVDDVKDPALKPVEKAGKEIKAAWIKEKQKEQARGIVESVKSELQRGVAPKTIAKRAGIEYKRVDGITRRGNELPVSVTYQLFNRPAGEAFSAIMPAEYFVVKSVKTVSTDPEKDKIGLFEIRRLLQEQAGNEKSDAVLADFSSFLGLQIKEDTTQKAFAYIGKSAQEKDEEE